MAADSSTGLQGIGRNDKELAGQAMNYEEAQRIIERVVFGGGGLLAGMKELLAYGQSTLPSPRWAALASWDWTRELPSLKSWLERLFARDAPPPEVDCLYLGVYFPERTDGQTLPVVYVAGTTRYDEEEWAAEPEWTPAGMDFPSQLLVDAERHLAAGGDALLELGDYLVCLGYVGLVAVELGQQLPRADLVGDRDDRWVAIGFEGGDWFNLGLLDHAGTPLGQKTVPDGDE